MKPDSAPLPKQNLVAAFAVFFCAAAAMIVAHARLLRLPYFWDEAGYYIPAARDLYLSGALIPHSTLPNAHPPLVMVYLALAWKLFGYSPVVTRIAMLLISAFALTAVFELARRIAGVGVAIASAICVAAYPVFFAQASLAHVDLAAAALTLWALIFYLERRLAIAALWFSLAVLAKETAIIAPLALFVWSLCLSSRGTFFVTRDPYPGRSGLNASKASKPGHAFGMTTKRETLWLLFPLLPLAAWFAFHFAKTGHVFGNPEFFEYNVGATMHPLRILFAAARRLWQLTGYMNLFVLTLATALAMFFPAQA